MPAEVRPGLSVIVPIASREMWDTLDTWARTAATGKAKDAAKTALAEGLVNAPRHTVPVGDIRWTVAHLNALAAPFQDLGEDDPAWTTVVLLAHQSVLQAVE